jgi:hypothetical protein
LNLSCNFAKVEVLLLHFPPCPMDPSSILC